MTPRKILAICTTCLALIALGIAVTPFGLSLKPNARADAALPRIDISNLKPEEIVLLEHPTHGYAGRDYIWSIILMKLTDGSIRAWSVPTKNGNIGMPDHHWWRPFFPCKDFGPSKVDGLIDMHSHFKCHDTDIPHEWWATAWQWDLSGKAIDSSAIGDMLEITGTIEGKYFVLGKRS